MEQLEAALRTEINETHRQYRREVVLYRPEPPARTRRGGTSSRPRRRTIGLRTATIKSGEAVAGAQELARRAGNPELTARSPDGGAPRAGAAADAVDTGGADRARSSQRPMRGFGRCRPSAADASPRPGARSARRSTTPSKRRESSTTTSSRWSTSCSRSSSCRARRSSARSRRCAAASA